MCGCREVSYSPAAAGSCLNGPSPSLGRAQRCHVSGQARSTELIQSEPDEAGAVHMRPNGRIRTEDSFADRFRPATVADELVDEVVPELVVCDPGDIGDDLCTVSAARSSQSPLLLTSSKQGCMSSTDPNISKTCWTAMEPCSFTQARSAHLPARLALMVWKIW